MFRNILAIFLGIFISYLELIILFIEMRKKLYLNIELKNIKIILSEYFNKFLLIIIIYYIIGLFSSEIITAFIVKKAKKAYSILTGFIFSINTLLLIIFNPFPLWFKIIMIPICFVLPYSVGNLVEFLIKKINI
ncbi:hypothetical protein [Blattabacterium cuenoti]|uniref:hypothetical protein n=1 Tax=Blattabacterium cuenoti TaxID=1653831 RepID=UPI00163C22FA|nr:hypothetical protein [Blattabacterium cuenoti]